MTQFVKLWFLMSKVHILPNQHNHYIAVNKATRLAFANAHWLGFIHRLPRKRMFRMPYRFPWRNSED